MNLPKHLSEKINSLYSELEKHKLKQTQKSLTDKYKNHTGKSTDLISNKNDSILYAISRMPATFSVIHSLIYELAVEGLIIKPNSVCDIGSGTGSAYFAISEIFDDVSFSLFEKNESMIDVFKKLSDNLVDVNKCNVINFEFKNKFDLVMTSFVLSEMTEPDRNRVFQKMLDMSEKYVLVIDTGTPDTYKNTLKLKDLAISKGYKLTAPCKCEVCPLENDYCQFYARVERSSLLRQAKSASLSYEDEKYFYLLFEKTDNSEVKHLKELDTNQIETELGRVIRRPKIKEKEVELVLCTKNGTEIKKVTKQNKQLFKKARKIKINEILSDTSE